ncbi:Replication factor C, sub 2 [Giardia muris]|uniref:Replication factor C, sub 2 n=1 Tax=Giardia muris TaxID=5742 RepID=A0A4Z1T0B1_GIAMU|nr:Replication factor C, sub 2 [Giardia muris]|eukprot:TNJ29138.1 Replication factor C, sub 2 [Giardia muris]
MAAPWTERYRPRQLAAIQHQVAAVSAAQQCVATGDLPHLLLYGPAGTGKTSLVYALAHELFGPRFWRSRLFEFNASVDRRINAVREKIKSIAQTVIVAPPPEVQETYPCPPIQIILLDEADALTKESQAALRRIMEDYSESTRFCIICNYPSQLIPPIVSRCARFAFSALPSDAIVSRLQTICQAEARASGSLGEQATAALREIARLSAGDMRAAITLCQTAVQHCQTLGKTLTPECVRLLSGAIPPDVVSDSIRIISDTTLMPAVMLDRLDATILRQGYPSLELIAAIWKRLCFEDQVHEDIRYAVGLEYQRAGLATARRACDRAVLERFAVVMHSKYAQYA